MILFHFSEEKNYGMKKVKKVQGQLVYVWDKIWSVTFQCLYTLSIRYTKNRVNHKFIKRHWLSWFFINDSKTLTGKYCVSSSTQSKLNSQTEHTYEWPEGLVKSQLLSSTVNVPWCLGWYLRICISNKENILIVKIVLFYWLRNILGFCILLMFNKQVKTFFRI